MPAETFGIDITARNASEAAFAELKRQAQQLATQLDGMNNKTVAYASSSRMAAQSTQMLTYQLNDIAVSLASGMNPAMVALQQGPQILQLGLDNVVKSLGTLAKALAPVGIAAGAVAVLFTGLTYEINKTAETQVSFGDVFAASMQLAAESIGGLLKPAIEQIGTWFKQLWDFVWPVIKDITNTIIGGFVGAYEAVKQAWSNLPTFFSAIGKDAWNGLIAEFEKPALTINGQVIIPGLDLSSLKSQLTEAEEAARSLAVVTFDRNLNVDYVGNALDAMSARAQELALTAAAAEELAGNAGRARDNMASLADQGLGRLADRTNEIADAIKSTFSGMGSAIAAAFRKGGDVAGSVLDILLDRTTQLGDQLLDKGLDMLLNIGLGALSGSIAGGAAIPMSGFTPGVTGPWLFAKGTANTGGMRGEPRGVVHGQEAVIPLPDGGKVPVQLAGFLSPPGEDAARSRGPGPAGAADRRH